MDLTILIVCTIFSFVICQSASFDFRIPEEEEVGYLIGNVLERSSISRTDIKFVLMKQGNIYEDYFSLNETTGNLAIAKVIDREELCEFDETCQFPLEVAAQSINDDGYFDVLGVNVIVEDINDNAPIFPQLPNSVYLPISEASLIGTPIIIKGARDKDRSSQFSLKTLELMPLNPNEFLPFTVNFTTKLDGSSTVTLKVSQKLNREDKDSYAFLLVAKDGGNPPLNGTLPVNISILDVNDNYPVFDQPSYNVTVREDVTINKVILTLKATDIDAGRNGDVRYNLSPIQAQENLDKFSLGDTSGELSVIGKLQYKENGYRIIVEAVDQSDSPLTTQTIVTVRVLDIQNDPPQIYVNLLTGSNFAVASEYANIGAVVAHVTITDPDTERNGDVICSVISDWFSLQRYDDNEYKVIVSSSLDRERHPAHNVTVQCNDKGNPPLGNYTTFLVKILDENDNEPRFMQQRYYATLFENNEIGDLVASVSAFDFDAGDNGKITYKMSTESQKYAFVNSGTGDVMANWIFDRENITEVNLTVYASDSGSPKLRGSTVINLVVKDKNDNTPIFTETSFRRWVKENLPSDSVVGHVTAKDDDEGDNGAIVYKLKPSSSIVPFVVFDDGLIKTDRELNREQQSEYTFEVIATDKGAQPLSSSALVTVYVEDANDNEPIIEYPAPGNNTVKVPYLTSPMTIIYSVIATDADEPGNVNAKLTYTMLTLNTTNFFSIDSTNGDIILVAPLANADLIDKIYVLNITVKDVSDHPKAASEILRVLITADNGTRIPMPEESSSNFVIAIAVLSITVVIAAAIIVTICILRRLDNQRRQKDARGKVLSENMYSKNIRDSDLVDGGFQLPMDNGYQAMDNGYQEKKKKEVSFSLEEGRMAASTPVPSESLSHHTDDLDRIIKPPQEYLGDHDQYSQLHIPKRLDDAHSDMSGDSAGDSGKGGSDDDLHSPVGMGHDDISRAKVWDQRRNKSPAVLQLQSLPTRYPQQHTIPNQKIVPFSFKNNPPYNGSSGSLSHNARAPSAPTSSSTSSYSVPLYYDDESRSSGFQSVDSISNLNLGGKNRNDGVYTFSSFRGNKPPDCVV